jgi:hypothetical protein
MLPHVYVLLIIIGTASVCNAFLKANRVTSRYFKPAKTDTPLVAPNFSRVNAKSSTQLQMLILPQITFVASCVAAIVAYIYFNIDEIREKQKIAVDKAMIQQSSDIKSAQDSQRAAIEKAQALQREAIEKIKRDQPTGRK